ncbi:MAG: hypothetical protein EOP56_19310 [Sphingobacteriales bacterium]|nr:MAG: hypothetical protein EOP56_19310 [Sphingobacteriales bacterium]
MDITTLALTAYTLAQPFLTKTGEGIARKIGEDIWSIIKKPFVIKGVSNVEDSAITNKEDFQAQLQQELTNNPEFAAELQKQVMQAQTTLSGNFQQNISSENVEKQINIQQNTGNIQM